MIWRTVEHVDVPGRLGIVRSVEQFGIRVRWDGSTREFLYEPDKLKPATRQGDQP